MVCVAGEGVQRDNLGAHGVQVTQNPHLQRAVHNAAAQGVGGAVSHKEHGVVVSADTVFEVVQNAPGFTHARGGDDDGFLPHVIEALGLAHRAYHVQLLKAEGAGVFPYSKEEGSLAAKMKNQVHHATRKRRANELSMILAGIADEIGQECVGQTIRVLVDAPGIARGPWDAPDVDGTIHVDPTLPVGEFADVQITDSIAYELFAEVAVDMPEEEE